MPSGTRYHNVIFVETDSDSSGQILQVVGSIGDADGMEFNEKRGRKPEDSETYVRKHFLGRLQTSDYENVVRLLQTVTPPPRQRNFNTKSKATEQCKPDGTFYGAHEPRPPYMKCTEWTLQRAIPALWQSGLLHSAGQPIAQPDAPQTQQSSDWVWDEAKNQHRRWNGTTWVYNVPSQAVQQSSEWVWDEARRRYRRWDGNSWIYQG